MNDDTIIDNHERIIEENIGFVDINRSINNVISNNKNSNDGTIIDNYKDIPIEEIIDYCDKPTEEEKIINEIPIEEIIDEEETLNDNSMHIEQTINYKNTTVIMKISFKFMK